MPAPTIESHGQNISSGGTTSTIAVTAVGASRVIVVCTTIGLNPANGVPSLTISGGGANVGAWTSIGLMPGPTSIQGVGIQAWCAVTTGAVSAQTVTITSTVTIDDAATAYVTVAGANIAQFLDQNPVLASGGNPGTGAKGPTGVTSGLNSIAVSTNTANVLVFVLMGNSSPITFPPLQSGTTMTESVVNGGGVRFAYLGVMTASFTTAQSGTQVGSTSTQASAGFAFATTADSVVSSPIELAGNLGGSSHYGKLSYGVGKYSRIAAFVPVFAADITVSAGITFSGDLAPAVSFGGDLSVAKLVDFAGDLQPQINFNGDLSVDIALTALAGSFGFTIGFAGSDFTAGPLWAADQPSPSAWTASETCPPSLWTPDECDPVAWEDSETCNG